MILILNVHQLTDSKKKIPEAISQVHYLSTISEVLITSIHLPLTFLNIHYHERP